MSHYSVPTATVSRDNKFKWLSHNYTFKHDHLKNHILRLGNLNLISELPEKTNDRFTYVVKQSNKYKKRVL